MDSDDETPAQAVPFQLQFDKPLPSQIKIAQWNPEKDLLAMVTEDSKIVLHRFNWQRLWTISPGKSITSICWRPDGKAIALGLEDGTVTMHDVENGKLLRSLRSHTAAVVCLNWEEDAQLKKDDIGDIMSFEDRTSRFFPPAPRVPRMPGLVPGDSGFIDDSQDSFLELSNSSHQRFNILCSGDRDGSLCFSIFGIFPIGKINIHSFSIPRAIGDETITCQLLNASIHKVALSKNLCHLIVACSGELVDKAESTDHQTNGTGVHGLHHLVLNTSIFQKRKNELHQVALQASNIEDLNEVVRESLSIIYKQWSDAMSTFHEKFDSLSNLIIDHGIDSSPQEEFLSLLGGARTSPAVHQFLVNSLGEVGVKRVSKVVCGAGKELQLIVLNHLQPATEIIAFRMGELRGLSKWRARFQSIGLDEALVESAAEEAGMLLVQVERFLRVLSTVVQQFANFFNWLRKCIKLLMSEPSDQPLTYNSELVIVFLKFLYDQDPVKQLLEVSEVDSGIEIDLETLQRVRELAHFGGFLDTEYLQRTLAKEFHRMEFCFKQAVQMPFSTISKKICCEDLMSLFPITLVSGSMPRHMPLSISYYEDLSGLRSFGHPIEKRFVDYISFEIPDGSLSGIGNCIAIVRGCMDGLSSLTEGQPALEAILLCMPSGYQCVDISLYKVGQIALLLNEMSHASESSGEAFIMILETSNLPFVFISRSTHLNNWDLHQLKDSVVPIQIKAERARSIPYSVIAPMAVSASRGVACVFAARKRALVYILEEDEDEISDAE